MPDDNSNTSEDIVERLLYVAEWGSTDPCELCIDAANEIERLRKLLWMIQDQSYHPSGYLKDMIEAAVKYE